MKASKINEKSRNKMGIFCYKERLFSADCVKKILLQEGHMSQEKVLANSNRFSRRNNGGH
jgi:hypothetical protein